MTTQKLSVALLGLVAALSLSACGGGVTQADCQAEDISASTREACLDKARDVLRDALEDEPPAESTWVPVD